MYKLSLFCAITVQSDYLTHFLEDELAEYVESGDILNISVSVSSSKGQSVTSSVQCAAPKDEQRVDRHQEHHRESAAVHEVNDGGDGDKYAVITGGSTGIGHEVCRRFMESGYTVINLSRSECAIEGVHSVPVDLCSKLKDEELALLRSDPVMATLLSGNGLSELHLIHCASNNVTDSVCSLDSNEMERSLMINAVNPAVLTSMLLPLMGDRSSILFIGSTLSHKAVANKLSYSTAKHAAIGLMRSITQDVMARNDERAIHSAVICPGFTDTEMLRSAVTDENRKGFQEFIASFVGMKRLITPSEIARFVYEVAQSPVLNGSVLDANGGQKEY